MYFGMISLSLSLTVNGSPGLFHLEVFIIPESVEEYPEQAIQSVSLLIIGWMGDEESQEVDLSLMVNRGSSSKSSGHEELGSCETDNSRWGGWEKCHMEKKNPRNIIRACTY